MSSTADPAAAATPLAERLGRGVRRALEHLGSIAWLAFTCARQALRLKRPQLGVLAEAVRSQVRFTALEALPLVSLTALLLGGVTLLQIVGQLKGLVSESYVTQLVVRLVVRELGPLLVAIVVVGRSGTAIAAEMASMKLGKEADTLYATGVDPIAYLLLPRIIGGVASLFSLVVFFDLVALLGGFLVASSQIPFSFRLYVEALEASIGPAEVAGTFLKAVAFGAAIPIVCAHSGLRLRRSATEIPQAVTYAAVHSIVALFLLSAAISLVCYA